MIRFGADAGRIALRGTTGDAAFETDVRLTSGNARRASLNGEHLASAERLRQDLRTLVFTPDRLAVVKGAPSTRRAYLDRSLGRLSPSKATLPAEYAAAVGQRNAGLRRLRGGTSSPDALGPWTRRVAELGAELVAARREAADMLAPAFTELAGNLGLDSATLRYDGEPLTVAQLDARFERDLERGLTGAGPHLHDVSLETSGRDLRSFGSQGEQRMAVLALVLAEAEVLRSRTGSSPLVLLDDVLSELDEGRRQALAEIVAGGGQTIITATAAASLPGEPAQALTVMPGTVG
jgi:DNA replication and repair protein RecF